MVPPYLKTFFPACIASPINQIVSYCPIPHHNDCLQVSCFTLLHSLARKIAPQPALHTLADPPCGPGANWRLTQSPKFNNSFTLPALTPVPID